MQDKTHARVRAEELTVTIRVMQSSLNEMSTPISFRVKCKTNGNTLKSLNYVGIDGVRLWYKADTKWPWFPSQLKISRMSSYTDE